MLFIKPDHVGSDWLDYSSSGKLLKTDGSHEIAPATLGDRGRNDEIII